MSSPHIENGFATVPGGSWLVRCGQPAAACGPVKFCGLKGFFAPDRRMVQIVEAGNDLHLASAERPFLTQVTVTDELKVVSSKLLVAPQTARNGGRLVRVIPMSFRFAFPMTILSSGWVVLATRSRVKRIVVAEDDIVTVRSDAVVSWTGKDPTGFCPRLRMRDILLPVKRSASLSLNFYGPQIVWTEGCNEF